MIALKWLPSIATDQSVATDPIKDLISSIYISPNSSNVLIRTCTFDNLNYLHLLINKTTHYDNNIRWA